MATTLKSTAELVLMSHQIGIPDDLRGYSARFEMALPTDEERSAIIQRVASE
mgnify:CR=1 FL=1